MICAQCQREITGPVEEYTATYHDRRGTKREVRCEACSHADELVMVEAPHFVAGFTVRDDRITRAAPILKRLIGLTVAEARVIIKAQRWRATYVKPARPE